MLWTINFTDEAEKQLFSLDKATRERIRSYVKDLEARPNPKMRGEPLTGNLANLWKYPIGKYRLQDEQLLVLVVKIGKRDKVYKTF